MDASFDEISSQFVGLIGKDKLWMIEIFVVIFLTLTLAVIVSHFLVRLERRAEVSTNLWDDALCQALSQPAKWFIWMMGLTYAGSIIAKNSDSVLFDSVDVIRHVSAIFIVSWFLNGFISRVEKHVVDPGYMRKPFDKTTAVAVGRLLRISVILTALLIAVQSLGYSISGVLAFGGIGGIAVGFAAKDLLANFFGGLMIYLDRPFTVGDWIRSPDQNIEGTVEEIGWRLTHIRTFDKRPLYVPNSTFTQISVENPSRMSNRRIYEKVGIRYDDADKIRAILADVKAMIEAHEAIDTNLLIMVNFNEFAASSLDFFIYCFTKTIDWAKFHEIKQDVLLKTMDIILQHGAECAFPTTTLHVPDGVAINRLESEN